MQHVIMTQTCRDEATRDPNVQRKIDITTTLIEPVIFASLSLTVKEQSTETHCIPSSYTIIINRV